MQWGGSNRQKRGWLLIFFKLPYSVAINTQPFGGWDPGLNPGGVTIKI